MDNLETYPATNQLLWTLRLACHDEKNTVGHNFICRIQTRLDKAVEAVAIDEEVA